MSAASLIGRDGKRAGGGEGRGRERETDTESKTDRQRLCEKDRVDF